MFSLKWMFCFTTWIYEKILWNLFQKLECGVFFKKSSDSGLSQFLKISVCFKFVF
ncbi:hypothetical protein LEP1GSC115_0877 [Leptospira interrogans serovar Australis str. 200703203]|uniref:Uncharacterized protein n=1 Tax=Leptospira interrogans serovar Australis str. 200703203 TaxID=1085541 RepID=N1UKK0_LEPIR|nr:hypothetical protein LEP1GSC115_0877 [Leptospira interrogans serovar Australis str. 200703203]